MKTFRSSSLTGLVIISLLAASTWWAVADTRGKTRQTGPVRFAVISDPHLYNARLGTSGSAYETYLLGDQKLLKESEAILQAALERIAELGVDFLLIPGDLTKDGELLNHVLMAKYLHKLEKSGTQVFVVPGNHDINNPWAFRYVGDTTRRVPNTSPKTFRAIYQRFGFGEAIARDSASLSYVAEPVPGLWLLAIDSCKYQENLVAGRPVVSGRLSVETLEWIRARLQDAKAGGKQVLAFMHHGVNAHFLSQPVVFGDYLLDDWPAMSLQLEAAGLKAVFTGHYHSQDAAWLVDETLNQLGELCDVQTGSLVQYPCAFRVVTIEGNSLNIQSERVTQINADTGGLPFQEFADVFLRTHMEPFVIYQLGVLLGFSPEEAAVLAPFVIDSLVANYVGDEAPTPETQAKLMELVSSPDPRKQNLGLLLFGIWTDVPPAGDNSLIVNFAASDDDGRPRDPVTPPPQNEF